MANIQVVASGFGLKATIAAWTSRTIRSYPISKSGILSDKPATCFFGRVPLVFPNALIRRVTVLVMPFDILLSFIPSFQLAVRAGKSFTTRPMNTCTCSLRPPWHRVHLLLYKKLTEIQEDKMSLPTELLSYYHDQGTL